MFSAIVFRMEHTLGVERSAKQVPNGTRRVAHQFPLGGVCYPKLFRLGHTDGMEPSPRLNLADALRLVIDDIRQDRGLSGRKLAAEVAIPYQTFRRYLDGRREFPVHAVEAVADLFGIKPSTLMTQAQQRQKQVNGVDPE